MSQNCFYPKLDDLALLASKKRNTDAIETLLTSLQGLAKKRPIAFPKRTAELSVEISTLFKRLGAKIVILKDDDFYTQRKAAAKARSEAWVARESKKPGATKTPDVSTIKEEPLSLKEVVNEPKPVAGTKDTHVPTQHHLRYNNADNTEAPWGKKKSRKKGSDKRNYALGE